MSEPSTPRVRVLLVDDEPLIREALAAYLEHWSEVELVGTAPDGIEGLAAVERHAPDVVLMDMRMPNLDGIAATRLLAVSHPSVKVLMLSAYSDPALVAEARAAGARDFLFKGGPPSEVIAAILRVAGEPAS